MLKVGVFGTGHLGKFHLNNWREIQEISLVGFFDPDDKTARYEGLNLIRAGTRLVYCNV